jgi:hypothetical protein
MLLIETRVLGSKSEPIDRWSIPVPPADDGEGGGGLTLRELISRIVRQEVEGFERRRRARRLTRFLSEREIESGAARGKVDPGGHTPSSGAVDVEGAIATALVGFEDGLYLVLLDGVEQRELDAEVFLNAESRVVFLRLTFLAGA